jgi:putative membrane protein
VKFAFLSHVNASLNFVSAVLLMLGYLAIKRGNQERHRAIMISALISSALFLVSYLVYHANVGSVPYLRHDWTRPLYFIILIPHVALAGIMVPFILAAVYYALKGRFDRHTRITRWLWPVWMFVSVSGVVVYLMLYHL